MENEEQESYDFECVDCEHLFHAMDAELLNTQMLCPKCRSENLLDLCDEGGDDEN